MQMSKKIACPVCKKDDQIQKVTSIRKSGISSGVYSGPTGGLTYSGGKVGTVGGFTTVSGSSMTRLAQLLPPPEAPIAKTYTSWAGVGILLGSFVLSFLVCFASGTGVDSGTSTVAFIIVAVGAFFGIIVGYNQKKQHDADSLAENIAAVNKYNEQVTTYERLYYCHRDDVCFDPKTNQYRPLMKTYELIYK
jgi:hypothetical protein